MTDTRREAFEAWWKDTMNTEDMDLHRHIYPGGKGHWNYACHETNRSWMTWQAATERATPQWISVAERLPLEDDGTVAVLMDDGSTMTAWATYWHGASNKFAQWTFPSDCDGAQVTHWSYLPPAIRQGGDT